MFVKNINGTSRHNPPAGYNSWLEFWEAKDGRSNVDCSVLSCRGKAEVGAHVIRTDIPSNNWYIIPLCTSCNNKSSDEIMKIYDTRLVNVID